MVGTAPDGREAVDWLAANDVELAFIDIEMPQLDGFGVIAEAGDRMPPVSFASVHTEFAVRSFEHSPSIIS